MFLCTYIYTYLGHHQAQLLHPFPGWPSPFQSLTTLSETFFLTPFSGWCLLSPLLETDLFPGTQHCCDSAIDAGGLGCPVELVDFTVQGYGAEYESVSAAGEENSSLASCGQKGKTVSRKTCKHARFYETFNIYSLRWAQQKNSSFVLVGFCSSFKGTRMGA